MLGSNDDLLKKAQEWKEAGRRVALATLVETWGSAPFPVGSHLVIDGDGNFLGSVSGGCVEGDIVAEALDVIKTGRRRMLEFGVADETAWRAGLSCGGRIRVYVERIERSELLAALNVERSARRACVLVTDVVAGEQRLIRAVDVGGDPMADVLEEQLRLGGSAMAQQAGREFFLNVQAPPTRLIAIGAVHISQALGPIARLAGFDIIVVDPRTAFATPERFPDMQIVAEWPEEALPRLGLDRRTAIALLTHVPRIDDPGLVQALRADCFYIGALGSRKTHARRLERMRSEGFDEKELVRIHAPIGLDIGAESPAEIAIAILGEIIASQRRKPLRAEKVKAA
jgi:xanthine dehydrogenase accessory factor